MRKYQQLLLVIISLISVCILLMYRSENSKLKYVLEYVNFFGRSDSVDLMVLRSGEEFAHQHVYDDPRPMWTRIGDDFHGYSAHWHKNDFAAGGEVVTIVIGMQRSEVNFRCGLLYPNSTAPVTGLFSYTRVDLPSSMGKETAMSKEHFRVYKFLCKVNKDFGPRAPRIVMFYDIHTGSAEHFMHINSLSAASLAATTAQGHPEKKTPALDQKVSIRSSVSMCVDYLPYNVGRERASNVFTEKDIFQFFLHHAIVGIQEFLVYEMNNFPTHALDLLQHQQGIRITRLAFNFPYEMHDELKIRGILEMDCLLRTSAHSKFVLLSRVNEFFLPTSNVRLNKTFTQSLESHPSDVTRFELPLQTVCMPETATGLRGDYSMYDAAVEKEHHPVYVFRPRYENLDQMKSLELGQSSGIIQRLSRHCMNSIHLKDWRQAITPEHLHFITEVEKELKMLLV